MGIINKNSISFGFYNGLGDFISELPFFEWFNQNGYKVTIFVYGWLKEFAAFMAPFAKIKSIKNTRNILEIKVESYHFFLSPGYLQKFSRSKTSALSYVVKKGILGLKTRRLIAAGLNDVYDYTFNKKKNYLDQHFFYMSDNLLKNNFEINYERRSTIAVPNYTKLYIFPFSGNKNKDYPLEDYLYIAKYFSKKYNVTIFVQGKDRKKVLNELKTFNILTISLQEVSQMIDDKTIVLANDSGPAHLAAYRGSAVVALYGITNSQKYKPNGRGNITALQGNNMDVTTISKDKIIDTISSL